MTTTPLGGGSIGQGQGGLVGFFGLVVARRTSGELQSLGFGLLCTIGQSFRFRIAILFLGPIRTLVGTIRNADSFHGSIGSFHSGFGNGFHGPIGMANLTFRRGHGQGTIVSLPTPTRNQGLAGRSRGMLWFGRGLVVAVAFGQGVTGTLAVVLVVITLDDQVRTGTHRFARGRGRRGIGLTGSLRR